MLLTKNLYGSEFHRNTDVPFGFRTGQMRTYSVAHNGGWYNALGEKIGWGDLGKEDLQKIKAEIPADEVFVCIPERASFWAFGDYGVSGGAEGLDIEAPGIDYIAKHMRFAVDDEQIYVVRDNWERTEVEWLDSHYGPGWMVVTRQELKNLLVFCAEKLRRG